MSTKNMLRIPAGKYTVELAPRIHKNSLYIGLYWQRKVSILHIWITLIPMLQLRISIVSNHPH